jgi:glutamate racemase
MASKVKIGVFDSGVGGLSVAKAIHRALPDYEVIFVNDKKHVPYGNKMPAQLLAYVEPILQGLVQQDCQVIVVACNTVTTTLISKLREQLPVPLIGMEPMVKPAAEQTKSGTIAVCATPTTLTSDRYKYLKATYAVGVKVLEPDCSDWSQMIETNQVDYNHIREQIDALCRAGADQIVLGCTHYHWIEDVVKQMATGRAEVVQPEQPVIQQLKKILSFSEAV